MWVDLWTKLQTPSPAPCFLTALPLEGALGQAGNPALPCPYYSGAECPRCMSPGRPGRVLVPEAPWSGPMGGARLDGRPGFSGNVGRASILASRPTSPVPGGSGTRVPAVSGGWPLNNGCCLELSHQQRGLEPSSW